MRVHGSRSPHDKRHHQIARIHICIEKLLHTVGIFGQTLGQNGIKKISSEEPSHYGIKPFGMPLNTHTKPCRLQLHCLRIAQAIPALLVVCLVCHDTYDPSLPRCRYKPYRSKHDQIQHSWQLVFWDCHEQEHECCFEECLKTILTYLYSESRKPDSIHLLKKPLCYHIEPLLESAFFLV